MPLKDIDRHLGRWKAIGTVVVAGWVFLFMGAIHLSERVAKRRRRKAGKGRDDGKGQ